VLKRACIGLAASWCLLACAGKSDGDAPVLGTGGTDVGVAGGGTWLPPIPADAGPETFGPAPVACSGTPAPAADVVRACVLAASCLPRLAVSLSECISERSPGSSDAPPCWLEANSCAEVAACFGFSITSTPCPSLLARSRCDGNQVVTCDLPRLTRDCSAVGGTCRSYAAFPDQAPDVMDTADCAVETPCEGTNDTYVCDGTKRFRCRAGVAFGEDCAARGMACENQASGASCVAVPSACADPGAGRCVDGSTGTFCSSERRSVTIDCAPLGFSCRDAPERQHGARCDAPTCTAAEVAQCFESCDGNTAHLCLGGQRYSVDCRTFGLQDCILDTRPGVGDTVRCGNE
jgi:hypothetical protein